MWGMCSRVSRMGSESSRRAQPPWCQLLTHPLPQLFLGQPQKLPHEKGLPGHILVSQEQQQAKLKKKKKRISSYAAALLMPFERGMALEERQPFKSVFGKINYIET